MNKIIVTYFYVFIFVIYCKSKSNEVVIEGRLNEARKYGEEEKYDKAIKIINRLDVKT